ncbi:hypothetical protein KEM60_00232 [Austwickia sp. TVS 96-490-7B]|uniref:FtsX-like permease family protein n=1 Tax=Austwickia sp. TVS 96-490-7B TaxID=2830843 RepID=UPI001C578586|nr:FtsX-like permease family protein [Austwickia sp. TVS 96-490-7B]MBW3084049.1 hypothetical protein [Austwickia sp. TVS 96-490-7B]
MTIVRILAYSMRSVRRNLGRSSLQVVMIMFAVLIFLIVTGFSRASTQTLDSAVVNSFGEEGAYRLTLNGPIPVPRKELTETVMASLAPYHQTSLRIISKSGPLPISCPGGQDLGQRTLVSVQDSDGKPWLPAGTSGPGQSEWCLGGLVQSTADVAIPAEKDTAVWGRETLFVPSSILESSRTLNNQDHPTEYLITIPEKNDISVPLSAAFAHGLAPSLLPSGFDPRAVISVTHIDSGQQIRDAAGGVARVYSVIGWAVLALGGLGILIAQLIILRDKSWLFGLSRALGANPRHVAAMVICEVVVVVVSGVGAGLVVAAAFGPTVATYARNSLGFTFNLLDWSLVPQLTAGTLMVMVLGAVYPSVKAALTDPMDVIESGGR